MAGLTGAVQESLLCLLCFDSKSGGVVRGLIPLSAWDSFYRQVAEAAYRFWDDHKTSPGEHTLDLIEDVVDRAKADEPIYRRLLASMEDSRHGINSKYVLGQATRFARLQQLKIGVTKAAERLQSQDVDAAEAALSESLKVVAKTFDPGLRLMDDNALGFLHEVIEAFPTGIPELDKRSYGPVRKELHLFVAPPKRGKSWWLVHLGRQAIMARAKVLYVTLEMSEVRVAQRFIQSLLSISKRKEEFVRQVFDENELGQFVGMATQDVPRRPSFADGNISKIVRRGIAKLRGAGSLIIKEFPTGSLSVRELEAYLQLLESSQKFIPDLILVDYADLMQIDSKVYRHDLGRLYKELRGLAVSRNVALATASQANREGIKTKLLRDVHIAEDISKVATADCVLTYNQTDAERRLGLARLFLADGRNDEDRFTILISQQYGLGQFCLSSTRLMSRYWNALSEQGGRDSPLEDKT